MSMTPQSAMEWLRSHRVCRIDTRSAPTIGEMIEKANLSDLGWVLTEIGGSVQDEYRKVRAAASVEYEKVRDAASVEYEKVTAPALAEYQKVCLSEARRILTAYAEAA